MRPSQESGNSLTPARAEAKSAHRPRSNPLCSSVAALAPAPRIQRLIGVLSRLREHADLNRADGFLQVRPRMDVHVLEQVQVHSIQTRGDHHPPVERGPAHPPPIVHLPPLPDPPPGLPPP